MPPTSPFLAPERDEAVRVPFSKTSGGTILYTVPGMTFNGTTTSAPGTGYDLYAPWAITAPVKIDQMAAEVTTLEAAQNFRMGIYSADVNWQPIGAPQADSGNISTATTGVKTYSPSPAIYLPRGRYVSVLCVSGNVAAFRKFYGPSMWGIGTSLGASPFSDGSYVARAFGAFPTPGTAWTNMTTSGSSQSHNVVYRLTVA